MQTDALQLEKLRQQIENAEYEIGNQMDYQSYGKPNPAQLKQSQELTVKMQEQSAQAKSQLHETIIAFRKDKPEALAEWIQFHKDMLERIIAEKVTDANTRTRQNVARGTLNEWGKVLAGEQEYININWHFLKDYKAEVRKLFPQNAGNVPKPEKAGKKSWEFWK